MNLGMSDRRIQYYIERLTCEASMSTCKSRSVAVLFVKDGRPIETGYNGPPKGYPHPTTCARKQANIESGAGLQSDLCQCLHAEMAAISMAARYGHALEGADVWCDTMPCSLCMGMIANAGISKVFFLKGYNSPATKSIADYAGISLYQVAAPQHTWKCAPIFRIIPFEEREYPANAEAIANSIW